MSFLWTVRDSPRLMNAPLTKKAYYLDCVQKNLSLSSNNQLHLRLQEIIPTALRAQSYLNKILTYDQLHSLPSQISYSTTLLVSPQQERRALIPRRALFDVRMQLMAESPDTSTPASSNTTSSAPSTSGSTLSPPSSVKKKKKRRSHLPGAGTESTDADDLTGLLGDTDLATSIYEGGYKTWEGATDLARLVLERGPRKDIDELARVNHIIEFGCGTALPTLVLFQHCLRNDLALPFTLADYNAEVLRLVTLPNLVCMWAMECAPEAMSPGLPKDVDGEIVDGEGELEVTPELLDRFTNDLEGRGIILTLLSGPWSPQLTKHLVAPLAQEQSVLCLAAETIYSPISLVAFAEVLVEVLKKARHSKAFIAAKRVYFGVGGSVDGFKEEVSRRGAMCGEVQNSGIEGCDRSAETVRDGGTGVGRCLLEVQMF